MKGKNIFTKVEIEILKKLIADKLNATPDKQKGSRRKIRNIGFYYSDFDTSKKGYTVADFENLIRSGRIKIIGDVNKLSPATPALERIDEKSEIVPIATHTILVSCDLNTMLDSLETYSFNPLQDSESKIANSSGNYVLCLRANSFLPSVSIKPTMTKFQCLEVIYTGIASGSLRTRDYRQHFKGNNAGRSTLRKSLGVLFGYQQIPRDKEPTTGKTKFRDEDEEMLTVWMCNNLIMYFLPTSNFESTEKILINHFNPPLNLKDNHNLINIDFRKLLSQLRKERKPIL